MVEAWEIKIVLLSLGFRSNYLDITFFYNIIVILELKKVVAAKVGGELHHKHVNIKHEDDTNWFDIAKRLNSKFSIFVLTRGKPYSTNLIIELRLSRSYLHLSYSANSKMHNQAK